MMLNMIKVAINIAFEHYYNVKYDIKQIAIIPKNSYNIFHRRELDNLDNLTINRIDVSGPNYKDKTTICKLAKIKNFLSNANVPDYHYYTVSGSFIVIKETDMNEITLIPNNFSKYSFTLNFLTVDMEGGEVFFNLVYNDNVNENSIISL